MTPIDFILTLLYVRGGLVPNWTMSLRTEKCGQLNVSSFRRTVQGLERFGGCMVSPARWQWKIDQEFGLNNCTEFGPL
jgi:hypothetical protein